MKSNLVKVLVLVPIVVVVSVGCAHLGTKSAPSPIANPVTLVLKGEKGRQEVTLNCSSTSTDDVAHGHLLHQRVEDINFKVKGVITEVKPNLNFVESYETISKAGPGDLHDFAYPEMGEALDVELSPHADVLKAGSYPKNSLFYLPPLPLPTQPVNPGDEWNSTGSWKSESGVEFTVQMKGRYVDQKPCGDFMCVNVAVSGEVHLPKEIDKDSGFTHKISGRFLFEPSHGLLTWSEFGSDELLQSKEAQVVVHSVLRSELVEPLGYRKVNREEPSCPFASPAK